MFDGGFVGDQGRKPGTASFAMSLLDEGAGKLDSLAIADRAERLGAQIASAAGLDTAFAAVLMMTDQADRRSHCWPTWCGARRFRRMKSSACARSGSPASRGKK